MTKYIQLILYKLNKAAGFVIAVLMAVISVVIIAQVLFRLLGRSLPWSEELARYLMEYITYLGVPICIHEGHLAAVTYFQDKAAEQVKRILLLATHLILIVFFVIVVFQGAKLLTITRIQVSPALSIPMGIPYFSLIIGGILSLLNCVGCCAEILWKKEASV